MPSALAAQASGRQDNSLKNRKNRQNLPMKAKEPSPTSQRLAWLTNHKVEITLHAKSEEVPGATFEATYLDAIHVSRNCFFLIVLNNRKTLIDVINVAQLTDLEDVELLTPA
jgi:hypothetical protein